MQRYLHSLPTSLLIPFLFANSLKHEVVETNPTHVLVANTPSKFGTKTTRTALDSLGKPLDHRLIFKLEQELLSDLVLQFNGTYSLREEVVKKQEAKKEYYQKFLRVFKLAQILPSIVE
eukprot:CAMPEP_0202964852 /NCGR_PEP_ID=MMETSP1396-20130829/8956_1 /ASSEMBLY_ACC=CAM_ASM_000872 /TAXON_ID= /ORGANISM="Pseudokeronopsis sp., Strain Brazil" /LENGTH=118 /DNA_ID=CAMNT_0049687289 /DNA_START=491 /DNA_END=847 /DNA_ORIENTATION=+